MKQSRIFRDNQIAAVCHCEAISRGNLLLRNDKKQVLNSYKYYILLL